MITIVISTYNKNSRLKICLSNINKIAVSSDINFEVIVVNDGSTDATFDFLQGFKDSQAIFPLKIIHLSQRSGRSVARNEGASFAKGERILFIDDDIIISEMNLCNHYFQQTRESKPIAKRGNILHIPWLAPIEDPLNIKSVNLPDGLRNRIDKIVQYDWSHEILTLMARRSKLERDISILLNRFSTSNRWLAATGGNLSVRKDYFFELGGFDTSLGLNWGLEDMEFGYRLEKANGHVHRIENADVFHLDHPVVDRNLEHSFALDYFIRKHGNIGKRLHDYFSGEIDILEIFKD